MSKEVVRCFERCQRAGFLPHAEASLICFMQQASSVEGEAGWEMWLLSRPFLFFPFLFYCFHAILFICFLSSGFASFSFPSSFPHPYCVLHWLTSRSPGSRQTFSLDLPLSLSICLFFVFFSPKRWLAAGASISISSSWHRGTNRQGKQQRMCLEYWATTSLSHWETKRKCLLCEARKGSELLLCFVQDYSVFQLFCAIKTFLLYWIYSVICANLLMCFTPPINDDKNVPLVKNIVIFIWRKREKTVSCNKSSLSTDSFIIVSDFR